ncbi:hypothetical protein K449DRAFT_89075 [Hypoxylon sp. EC38]|nr:hypothetical protein K449DRAFT_89075 [Hypoxylon sp. EC38]
MPTILCIFLPFLSVHKSVHYYLAGLVFFCAKPWKPYRFSLGEVGYRLLTLASYFFFPADVVAAARGWLDGRKEKRIAFLHRFGFVHFLDSHSYVQCRIIKVKRYQVPLLLIVTG